MTARHLPPPGVVDLWTAPLHPADDVLAELIDLLAPDELARARRFRSPQHRTAFVASRGFQRRVLNSSLAPWRTAARSASMSNRSASCRTPWTSRAGSSRRRSTRPFAACSADQRDAAFLRCWTAKEAWVKAIGLGLAAPLDRFTAPVRPGDDHTLRDAETDRPIVGWTLHSRTIDDRHIGAVVVEARELSRMPPPSGRQINPH